MKIAYLWCGNANSQFTKQDCGRIKYYFGYFGEQPPLRSRYNEGPGNSGTFILISLFYPG